MTKNEIFEQMKKDKAFFYTKANELEQEMEKIKNPLVKLRTSSKLIASKVLYEYLRDLLSQYESSC